MLGGASAARTAMEVATDPTFATVSASTAPFAARSATCALVRMTTSQGAPDWNFSSIAPTAPKLPATSTPRLAASVLTTPWAAPALTNSSFKPASLVGLGAGDAHDARPLVDVL